MTTEYENPWFRVVKEGRFHIIEEARSEAGAVVLLVVDGSLIMVKVERPAHHEIMLEVPRGYAQKDESSQKCAARELWEETGYRVEPECFRKIGSVRPNSAILRSNIPVYLVELDGGIPEKPHDGEVSSVLRLPIQELRQMVATGEIVCGITLAALGLFWAQAD